MDSFFGLSLLIVSAIEDGKDDENLRALWKKNESHGFLFRIKLKYEKIIIKMYKFMSNGNLREFNGNSVKQET